ncbi:MAG: hypothetical protein ACRD1E_04220, partial [Terriglobales bacterium]
ANPDASGEGDAAPALTSLPGLEGSLRQLSGAAPSASDAPDSTARAGFARAKVLADTALGKWNQLRTSGLDAVNRQLQQANLPPVTVGPSPR